VTVQDIDLAEAIRIEIELKGDADYTIPEIVDLIERNYPQAVADATRDGRRAIVTKAVKAQVAPPASQQPRLPGFEELPLRISLPAEGGGYTYRSTRNATEQDFAAHLQILDDGIASDTLRRNEYAEAVNKVVQLLRANSVHRICELPS
jgi:hypothetical protein